MSGKWKYHQSTGELNRGDSFFAIGYSGNPEHKNDTASEGLRSKGPVPRGVYRMFYVYKKHPKLGSYAIALKPVGHRALGRSDFMVHADSVRNPGTASHGCIIMPLEVRKSMAACVGSGDDSELIEVI